MANETQQKLQDDLVKLSVFIQDYLVQISNFASLDNKPFKDQISRFLAPYSDTQIQLMHDDADNAKQIPLVAQSLYKLLTDPSSPPADMELSDELGILHSLLHAPGKVLTQPHPDNIIVNLYDFTPLIGALTKINLLRDLFQHFEALQAYRQKNPDTVDADFPLLKNITKEWLLAQFNAIKVMSANPHHHVGRRGAAISVKAFPEVGGDPVNLAWHADQDAPVVPPQPAPALIGEPPRHRPIPIMPVPVARHHAIDHFGIRRNPHRDAHYNPYVPPAYVPPAPRYPAANPYWYNPPPPPRRNGRFKFILFLLGTGAISYYYRAALASAVSTLLIAPITIGKTVGFFALNSLLSAASFGAGLLAGIASASFAILATASWPVLIGLSLFALVLAIKGAHAIANRSHAAGREDLPINPDFEQRLRDHLRQQPRQEDNIGPGRVMRFSQRSANPVSQENRSHPSYRNRRSHKI